MPVLLNYRDRQECLSYFLEAIQILARDDKRSHHLRRVKVAAVVIEFLQPEIVSSVIRVRSGIWIAPQITQKLHQHKRRILLATDSVRIFRNSAHNRAAAQAAVNQVTYFALTKADFLLSRSGRPQTPPSSSKADSQ